MVAPVRRAGPIVPAARTAGPAPRPQPYVYQRARARGPTRGTVSPAATARPIRGRRQPVEHGGDQGGRYGGV
ncbi:hypothetical protein AB4039_31040, partial [Streptomyces sp. M-16]